MLFEATKSPFTNLFPLSFNKKVAPRVSEQAAHQAKLENLVQENKEVASLYNTAISVSSSLNLKELLWKLYKESGQLIDTTNFAVILYDEQSDILNFPLLFEEAERKKPFSVKRSPRCALINKVLKSGIPHLVSHLNGSNNQLSDLDSLDSERPIRSWIGVPIRNPIMADDRVWGLIVVWSYEPDTFSSRDQWLLSAIGTQAAIAIRNVKLLEASRWQAMELAIFNEVIQTLTSTLDLDEVLSRIVTQVERMLQVERGTLFLVHPKSNKLISQISLGDQAAMTRNQKWAKKVQKTGQRLIVNRSKSQKDNILCVPLVLRDQVLGVIEVRNRRRVFSRHEINLLTSLASYASVAIGNARLHQNILAERDRVAEVEEQARKELARDLHDGPTQLVSSIAMRLDFCQKALHRAPFLLPEELTSLREMAERAAHQLRTLLFELRPLILETEGLIPALQLLLERRQQEVEITQLKLNVKSEITRLGHQVEAALFAIVQEAIGNALKHAQAQEIVVSLSETEKGLYLKVIDDGIGLDVEKVLDKHRPQHGHLGMINIQERVEAIGADMNLISAPGGGTRLTVYVPKNEADRTKKRNTTALLSS